MIKWLIWLLIPALCFGQPIPGMNTGNIVPNPRNGSQQEYMGGEHAPLIFTGAGQNFATPGVNTYTTSWIHTGWSPSTASATSNKLLQWFNPEVFTLAIRCRLIDPESVNPGGNNDRLQTARFECAYDTTVATVIPAWNADSTNLFIADGNYNHSLYGQWMFEDLNDTVRTWIYPLRIQRGGYTRFVFGSADTLRVEWTFIAEH